MQVNNVFSYSTQSKWQQNKIKNTNNILFRGGLKVNKQMPSDIVEIFKCLVAKPSPSLNEKAVSEWIMDFCKENKICAKYDNYKNIKIDIPATDKAKKPLLLSAHMDVVGDDSPVKIVTDGNFIKTDGKRTLGADDKAGIAAALKLAKDVIDNKYKHGGVEMLFTRDEELGFSGIKNADLSKLNSKYVLVLDEAKLGRFDNSGAGYTTVTLALRTLLGGHSALDIKDKKRINAAKAICDLIAKFPQGVYSKDKNGSTTSINVGTIIAGNVQNSIKNCVDNQIKSADYCNNLIQNAETNVINRNADAALSIRSSDRRKEQKLRQRLINIVEKFNQKYKGLATTTIKMEELMPIFEKSEDSTLEKLYKKACKSVGLKPSIGEFPGCAESHIYANRKNKNNENFVPALLGIADIYEMHSPSEKIDFISLKKGYELIKEMFLKFNA